MLLLETPHFSKLTIVEDLKEKLPEGVLCRVSGDFGTMNEANKNKRVYKEALWNNVLSSDDTKRRLSERRCFGEADHPDSFMPSLSRVSHVVTALRPEPSKNRIFGEADILDTPSGRILNTLFKAKCTVGVSSRGAGKTRAVEGNNEGILEVDPDSYKYAGHDFVVDPSGQKAFPGLSESTLLTEDVKKEILDGLNAKKDDVIVEADYISGLLESLGVSRPEFLVESLSKKEEDSKKQTEDIPDLTKEENKSSPVSKEMESFKADMGEKDKKIALLSKRIESLAAELDAINNSHGDLTEKVAKTESEKKTLAAEKDAISKEKEALSEEKATISEEKEGEVSSLKEEIKSLRSEASFYETQKKRLEERVNSLSAETVKLREEAGQVETLTEKVESLQEKLTHALGAVASKDKKIAALRLESLSHEYGVNEDSLRKRVEGGEDAEEAAKSLQSEAYRDLPRPGKRSLSLESLEGATANTLTEGEKQEQRQTAGVRRMVKRV